MKNFILLALLSLQIFGAGAKKFHVSLHETKKN